MNLADRLLARIQESRRLVLVIGDLMVDRWYHGRVEACQDGCPKFVVEHVGSSAGGAGNAARSVHKWGATVQLYSYTTHIPTKDRYLDSDGRIAFRVDRSGEATRDLFDQDILKQRRDALAQIPLAHAVLLSDYDKGFLSREFIRDVASKCRGAGIPCVADCKRAPEVYEGCILKGNSQYACKHKIGLLSTNKLVVTDGENEPFFDYEQSRSKLPRVKCVNHVGAGDCFAAHMTLALAYGYSLRDAAAIAHSAGRVYVQHLHNRPPLPSEVATDLVSATSR